MQAFVRRFSAPIALVFVLSFVTVPAAYSETAPEVADGSYILTLPASSTLAQSQDTGNLNARFLAPGILNVTVPTTAAQSLSTQSGSNHIVADWDKITSDCNDIARTIAYKTCEPDYIMYEAAIPNDPLYSELYGMDIINAPAAWDITVGSRSVVVAVIDSGIDHTHVELNQNMWTNPGEIPNNGIDDDVNRITDDYYGFDFFNEDSSVYDFRVDSTGLDVDMHGTHVAGTIGAVGNNEIGITGVAQKVSLMSVKAFEGGSGTTSAIVNGIYYSVFMKAKIINASWKGANSFALRDAVEFAGQNGVLFVAAAGNDSQNNDVVFIAPANYPFPNVIAVAATDRNDNLASFSNFGVRNVDIAAPGVDIFSTYPQNRGILSSGTSMATPHVTGTAALLWSKYPEATMEQVKEAILLGAESIPSLRGRVAKERRLDAHGALLALETILNVPDPTPTPQPTPQPTPNPQPTPTPDPGPGVSTIPSITLHEFGSVTRKGVLLNDRIVNNLPLVGNLTVNQFSGTLVSSMSMSGAGTQGYQCELDRRALTAPGESLDASLRLVIRKVSFPKKLLRSLSSIELNFQQEGGELSAKRSFKFDRKARALPKKKMKRLLSKTCKKLKKKTFMSIAN